MFKSRKHYVDEKPRCTFPTTKLKNIKCVICKYPFYVRDLVHLRGSSRLPLLLICGHAACQDCVVNRKSETCSLCDATAVPGSYGTKDLLPVNTYIIGLINVSQARPIHGDEPDILFSHSTVAKTKKQSLHPRQCSVCGVAASIRCLTCQNALFCVSCSDKLHKDPKNHSQSTGHSGFWISDNDPPLEMVLCEEHYQIPEYYCEDCKVATCSHCMLKLHGNHKFVHLSIKNEECAEELERVHNKLAETMQRVRQTEKKLKSALVHPDELQDTETIEAAINQHFTRLHGVLQNIEKRMVKKLYEQQSHVKRNLSNLQKRLIRLQDEVQDGLTIAAAAKEVGGKIILMEVITKLEALANAPCHLVRDPIVSDEKITFSPDTSIFELLENHCEIVVPEVAGFKLLAEDELPPDYEIEPLVTEELTVRDKTLTSETSLERFPSCQSVCSHRSENKVLKPNEFQKGHNTVRVLHVDNPLNFYVRLAALQKQADDLINEITDYAENESQEPTDVKLNEIYAVHSSDNWFRGRVYAINTEPESSDTYEIFNVDYGKIEHGVEKSRIRCIPTVMATKPRTIVNCSLYDMKPNDDDEQGALKAMLKMIKSNDKREIDMFIVKEEKKRYLVDLYTKPSNHREGSPVSVRDSLIFTGHASYKISQQLPRTNLESVRRYFKEDLKLNTYHDVKCSHVESPDYIYIQKGGEHLLHLAELSNDMSKDYRRVAKHQNEIIHVPEIGMPCAIEKAKDMWCRGIIDDVPAPQTVEVRLVDFGSKIKTDWQNIRKLHERYMTSPSQAIKIALTDVKPCDGDEWSEEAIKFTKKHLEDTDVRIIAFEGTKVGYGVALYLNKELNFAAMLVTAGHAVSTGPRSFGAVKPPIQQSNAKKRNGKVRNARTFAHKKTKRKMTNENSAPCEPAVEETTESTDPFRVPVKIIRVESPDTIYVSDPMREIEYKKMFDQMQHFYNRYQKGLDKCQWTVGSSCAVYSTRDRSFCRGKITAIESTDRAQVFLFDLAFDEKFPISELQPLKKAFWRTKAHAFKVKLAGLSPCGGSSTWLAASCEMLKTLIRENEKCNFSISKVLQPGENDLYVDLWVQQSKIDGPFSPASIEINSVNRMLVEKGFAIPIKQSEKSKMLAIELKLQVFGSDNEPRNDDLKLVGNEESTVDSDDDNVSSSVKSAVFSPYSNVNVPVSEDKVIDSWLPAEIIDDDEFIAMPTYVDHSCHVHLHSVAKSAKKLQSIKYLLTNEYAESTATSEDYVWAEGDLCIAQYHDDKMWYRGQVREVSRNGTTKVELIDYGNVEDCHPGTLRKRLMLTDIPRQSTRCVISGLNPNTPTGKWLTYTLDIIHSVLVERQCEVYVRERVDDYMVVTINILSPRRCALTSYLIKDWNLDVRPDSGDEEDFSDGEVVNNSDKIESVFDERPSIVCNDDVIVEGFLDDLKSNENVDKVSEKDIEDEAGSCANEKNFEENFKENFEENVEENFKENVEENVEKNFEKNVEDEEADNSNADNIEEKENIHETVTIVETDSCTKDIDDKSQQNDEDTRRDEEEEVKTLSVDDIEENEDNDANVTIVNVVTSTKDIHDKSQENVKDSSESSEKNASITVEEVAISGKVEDSGESNCADETEVLSGEKSVDLSDKSADVVLSGAIGISCINDRTGLNNHESSREYEIISPTESCCLEKDEFATSTPHNESNDCVSYSPYKKIVLPDDVKVFKAEVTFFGSTLCWIHLLDNKNSKIITELRDLYENIKDDLRQAETQPILENFKIGTPCCVKFSDGEWYRCEVADCESALSDSGDTVWVHFVDFGGGQNVKCDEIRVMKPEWMEAPSMSLSCRLWGVEVSPTVDVDDLNNKVSEAYSGYVPGKAVYVELKDSLEGNYDAQIYTDKECTELIYDSLIKEGYFVQRATKKID